MRSPLLAGLSLVACACAHQPSRPPPEAVLPLKSVRLYETGVGYFERTGRIGATERIGLPVPASHLDDALKTLVILGSGGADDKPVVQAVEFPTSLTEDMARTLAGLPSSGTPLGMEELLLSLRGTSVRVVLAHEQVSGRIVDVVGRAASEDGASKPAKLAVLLLTDSSEIRHIDADSIQAVRPSDPAQLARLNAAVDASFGKARAQRRMRVLARTSGSITLGYIAEAPLWRATYRLVLDPTGGAGVLQAWALLHNDTDEDWSGVKVELVNGRPTSFLFPLAAPRYGRRELVHPDAEFSTVPQLLTENADALWGEFSEGTASQYGTGAGTLGGKATVDLGISGVDSFGHGGLGIAEGAKPESEPSDVLAVGNLAEVAQASGAESGALFTYVLPAALDLERHASALVPFLQRPVEVEVLAFIDAPGALARSGVRLVNTTGQTLPEGPLAAFAEGGLAGEGALRRLKPSQRQIIQYGIDPDVSLQLKKGSFTVHEETRRVTFANDTLQKHSVRTTESVYVLENRGGQPRSVYVGLPVIDNAKVTGADSLEYDTEPARAIAVFHLEPHQKIERSMRFEEGLSRPMALAALSSEVLTGLASSKALPESALRAVSDAVAAQRGADETTKALAKVNAEIAKIEKDLERLRGHLEAASGKGAGPAAVGNPFVKRLLSTEDRLEALREKAEALGVTSDAQRNEVRDALKRLGH